MRHRAVYLWSGLIFMTSIRGVCMVTRRNIAAEVISFIFIVLCDDIIDPRNGTSEPVEHMFGLL